MQNHLLCKCLTPSLLDLLGIYLTTTESLSLSVTVTQTHRRAQLTSFTSTAVGATEAPGRLSPRRTAPVSQHALLLLLWVRTARAPRGTAALQTHTQVCPKCQGKVGSDKLSPGSPWRRAAGVGSTMQNKSHKPAVLGLTTSCAGRAWNCQHTDYMAPAAPELEGRTCKQQSLQYRGSTQIKDSEQMVWWTSLAFEMNPLIVLGGTFISGVFREACFPPRPAFECIPQVQQMRKPF